MDNITLEVPSYIPTMLNIAMAAYFLCGVSYGVLVVGKRAGTPNIFRVILYAVSLEHGAALILRWASTGRPPLISLYEMLIFMAWLVPLCWLILERFTKFTFVGALSYILAALFMAYSNVVDKTIEPLMPALRSNWLTIHIFTYLVAYAGALVAFIMALCYLAQIDSRHRWITAATFGALLSSVILGFDVNKDLVVLGGQPILGFMGLALLGGILMMIPLARLFNYVSLKAPGAIPTSTGLMNRVVGFSFPFFTLGIVTGAVWAQQAWGIYWSWDNKENWALITWAIYAAYLHSVYVMDWRHTLGVYLVVVGFFAMMITWLGVNYLPFLSDPLHSYASGTATLENARWGFGLYARVGLVSIVLSLVLAAMRPRTAAK